MHSDIQNCSLKKNRVLFTQHTALQKYFSTIITLSKSKPYLLADIHDKCETKHQPESLSVKTYKNSPL